MTTKEIAQALISNDRLKYLALAYAKTVLTTDITDSMFGGSQSIYSRLTAYAARVMRIDADKRNSEWNALADATALGITAATEQDLTDELIEAALPVAFELMTGITKEDKDVTVSYEDTWQAGIKVVVDQRLTYNGNDYLVVQAHVTQADWTPDVAKALFRQVTIDEGTGYPIWVQPTGAQDAYALGAIVTHNGSNWESTVDNNVWEPGVFGWSELV